uniref:Uncharacterized protein n=1 Tax=Rhizophora mucronata TaxID=61149 RepID=A0A2P2NQF3_RHIMU
MKTLLAKVVLLTSITKAR